MKERRVGRGEEEAARRKDGEKERQKRHLDVDIN